MLVLSLDELLALRKCSVIDEIIPQSWICQVSNFYFIYTVIQICYSDSDNHLIPDQGQAEAGEKLQGIKFWECMKPWLGYNSCGKSLDLSCTLILSVTCSNLNRIIWSKGSLGVLIWKSAAKQERNAHLRDCCLVKLLLLYLLQWSDSNLHQLRICPGVFYLLLQSPKKHTKFTH